MDDLYSKECRLPNDAPYQTVDNKTREHCMARIEHGHDFLGVPSVGKPEIQELKTTGPDGGTLFIYFAWIDGRWVDLAPYGNRLP